MRNHLTPDGNPYTGIFRSIFKNRILQGKVCIGYPLYLQNFYIGYSTVWSPVILIIYPILQFYFHFHFNTVMISAYRKIVFFSFSYISTNRCVAKTDCFGCRFFSNFLYFSVSGKVPPIATSEKKQQSANLWICIHFLLLQCVSKFRPPFVIVFSYWIWNKMRIPNTLALSYWKGQKRGGPCLLFPADILL